MSLKKDFISGTFYVGVAKYAGIICQLIISMILARILTPEVYGTVAIATVFIAFFNIISDIGIGVAVIQRKDLSDYDLDHLYSINVYIGLILSLLFFSISGLISDYYAVDELLYVCQLLSLLILFTCLRTVPMNLLYKTKQFKYIAFTTLSVQIISGTTAIIAALQGWGVYALVLAQLMSSILLFIIYSFKCRRHFCLNIDFSPVKKIFSYSIYNFGSTLVCYLTMNIDKILIGKYTGVAALGYYEKSDRLVFMPISNITFVITPVLHPLFSEFQNNLDELYKKYIKIVEALAYISFPISVFFFFTSKELILLFFGNQWIDAIPVFRIMSLAVSFLLFDTTVGSIFLAANETKRAFYTMLAMLTIMVVSLVVAIYFWNTILAIAYAYLFAKISGSLLNYYSLMHGLNRSYFDFIKIIIKPFIIGAILFLFFYFLTRFLSIENIFLSIVVKSIMCVTISLGLISIISNYNIKYLYFTAKNKVLKR